MRWIVSTLLLTLGVASLCYLSGGALVRKSASFAVDDGWGSALNPLWNISHIGGLVLNFGVAAIVFGAGVHFWRRDREPARGGARHSNGWSPAIQVAFTLNVLVTAVLILCLTLAMRESASLATIGSLYLWVFVTALVGASLAFALIWLKKSRMLYASALTFHLVEVGAIATVFIMAFAG